MNALKALVGLLATTCLFVLPLSVSAQTSATARASQVGSPGSGVPVIYVSDFQAITPSPDDESGLFASKRAERDTRKIDANAQSLADAVVRALRDKGATAYRLAPGQPIPASGWLVDGTYQQTISHNPFPTISALVQPSKPNTDASIRITDLSAEHAGKLAGFSTAATLKGQGTAIVTNPYELVAHVVINRVEANSSMNTLGGTIADRILAAGSQATVHANPLRS